MVVWETRIVRATSRTSFVISPTSADSIATSVPELIAMPTSACARAAAT